jgi:hypothetical protein
MNQTKNAIQKVLLDVMLIGCVLIETIDYIRETVGYQRSESLRKRNTNGKKSKEDNFRNDTGYEVDG